MTLDCFMRTIHVETQELINTSQRCFDNDALFHPLLSFYPSFYPSESHFSIQSHPISTHLNFPIHPFIHPHDTPFCICATVHPPHPNVLINITTTYDSKHKTQTPKKRIHANKRKNITHSQPIFSSLVSGNTTLESE